MKLLRDQFFRHSIVLCDPFEIVHPRSITLKEVDPIDHLELEAALELTGYCLVTELGLTDMVGLQTSVFTHGVLVQTVPIFASHQSWY